MSSLITFFLSFYRNQIMQKKILIIENDADIVEALNKYYGDAGYEVLILESGDRVISEVRHNHHDVILLDFMIPGEEGLEIIKEIRSFSNIPIIMLSSRTEEIDRLLCLELGADDYICKPFSPREVVSRTKAILRRCCAESLEVQSVVGSINLDTDARNIRVGKNILNITPIEFELLKILMSRPNYVFTRGELISNIKRCNHNCDNRAVDSHIKNLRKKFKKIGPEKNIIKTVYGFGYSINADSIDKLIANNQMN
jgi:two-component system, OmpR family, response regulator BaeR